MLKTVCKVLVFVLLAAAPLIVQTDCSAQRERIIRVAMFVGKGATPRPIFLDKLHEQKDMRVTYLKGPDIRHGALQDFDIMIAPGGLSEVESHSLKEEGRQEIRRFVEEGGDYIGICAGCYLATDDAPEYLGLIPAKILDKKHWHRGQKELPIAVSPLGQQVMGIDGSRAKVIYHNGPVMRIREDSAADVNVLARYEAEIVAPGGEPGLMKGAPAMVLTSYGKGIVIGISPHPERTPGLRHCIPHAIRWAVSQK